MTIEDSCGCDSHDGTDAGPIGTPFGNRSLVSRRKVLGGMLGAGIVTMVGSSPASAALRALAVPGSNDDRVLVNLFLRGGADGLNIVVPYGDSDYYRHRNSIAQQRASLSNLDGFFGLNQAFRPLYPLYQEGELAFVHAVGSPTPNGSHFAAMDDIDFAFGAGGWMERALTVSQQTAPVSALTISQRSSPALRGKNGGVAFASLEKFRRSSRELSDMRPALESMYRASGDGLTSAATLEAFTAVDTLSSVSTSGSGTYPNGKLAAQLREAATLIKADIGVRMISIGYGGWDHHSNEENRMGDVGSQLSEAIAAFQADLGGAKGRVMTVVMSEFGRTARENGSGGTDHGYGTVMTLVGGGLTSGGGGRVHLRDGKWVGLAEDQLVRKRNLAVSTDFRAVLSEVLEQHMGISDDGRIFPGYTPEPLGVFSGGPPAPANNPPAGQEPTTTTTAVETNPGQTGRTTGTQAPSSGGTQGGSTTSATDSGSNPTSGRATGNSTPTSATNTAKDTAGATPSSGGASTGSSTGSATGGVSVERTAPLVVNTPNASVAPSAAASSTGAATTAAADAAAGTTSSTVAALGSSAENLAAAPGVQQSVTSGGLGIGKLASAAAASTFGAAALVGGFLWRKRPQPEPLVYPYSGDENGLANALGADDAWSADPAEH